MRNRQRTGRTETRIVASKATISEMRANVSITAHSCFPGFHSTSGTSPRSSRLLSRLVEVAFRPITRYPRGFLAIMGLLLTSKSWTSGLAYLYCGTAASADRPGVLGGTRLGVNKGYLSAQQ